jgi:hypothetical protein
MTSYTLHEQVVRKLKADHLRLRAMVRNVQSRLHAVEARSGLREDEIMGKFAEEVAASTEEQMTAGELTVWHCDGSGARTATERTETVYNFSGGAITADKFVICHRDFRSGIWLGIAEDCATPA